MECFQKIKCIRSALGEGYFVKAYVRLLGWTSTCLQVPCETQKAKHGYTSCQSLREVVGNPSWDSKSVLGNISADTHRKRRPDPQLTVIYPKQITLLVTFLSYSIKVRQDCFNNIALGFFLITVYFRKYKGSQSWLVFYTPFCAPYPPICVFFPRVEPSFSHGPNCDNTFSPLICLVSFPPSWNKNYKCSEKKPF